MFRLALLPCLLFIHGAQGAVDGCGTTPIPPDLDSGRIVNGEEVKPYSWPWQIALCRGRVVNGRAVRDCQLRCGGSIADETTIITAAHCVGTTSNSPYFVKYSVFNIRDTNEAAAKVAGIASTKRHPGYSSSNLNNDIAIVKLRDPLEFDDKVQPVCLATNEDDLTGSDETNPGSGTPLYTTGWGQLSINQGLPPKLQQVELEYRSRDYCKRNDNINIFSDDKICAGGKADMKGACHGDSGGPLVGRNSDGTYTLYGVTSYKSTGGRPCVGLDAPTGYSRVSYNCEFINTEAGSEICG